MTRAASCACARTAEETGATVPFMLPDVYGVAINGSDGGGDPEGTRHRKVRRYRYRPAARWRHSKTIFVAPGRKWLSVPSERFRSGEPPLVTPRDDCVRDGVEGAVRAVHTADEMARVNPTRSTPISPCPRGTVAYLIRGEVTSRHKSGVTWVEEKHGTLLHGGIDLAVTPQHTSPVQASG